MDKSNPWKRHANSYFCVIWAMMLFYEYQYIYWLHFTPESCWFFCSEYQLGIYEIIDKFHHIFPLFGTFSIPSSLYFARSIILVRNQRSTPDSIGQLTLTNPSFTRLNKFMTTWTDRKSKSNAINHGRKQIRRVHAKWYPKLLLEQKG